MNLLQSEIHFPDNVLRNIARFLQPIENNIKIKIEQYTGCYRGTHSFTDYCDLCQNIYKEPKVYFYLLKNGNKKLFKGFMETVKKITQDADFPLKSNLEEWDNMPRTKPYWTMQHLFEQPVYKVIFKKIDVVENLLYDEKYVMSGTYFALFSTYIREIVDNLPYYIKIRNQRASVHSSSQYYILKHENLYLKNNLAITNRMFQKYTFPQNQFNN
tara:strand:- start:517 stop:1158 length:642 start_codon:yes stop_codon:yes gene_type:complete